MCPDSCPLAAKKDYIPSKYKNWKAACEKANDWDKYSTVSSAIEKMKRDISTDSRLKARVNNIEKIL